MIHLLQQMLKRQVLAPAVLVPLLLTVVYKDDNCEQETQPGNSASNTFVQKVKE